jgi:hypothetical protein
MFAQLRRVAAVGRAEADEHVRHRRHPRIERPWTRQPTTEP